MIAVLFYWGGVVFFWGCVGYGSLGLLYLAYLAVIGQITNIWLISSLIVAGYLILVFYVVIIRYIIRRIVYKLKKIDDAVIKVLDEGPPKKLKVMREMLPPKENPLSGGYSPIVGLGNAEPGE